MRLAGHVTRVRERKDAYGVLVRRHVEDPGICGMIILKWILRSRFGLFLLRIGTGVGLQ
jgi:hypothetical protein